MVSGGSPRLMKRLLPFLVLFVFIAVTSLWLWARSAPLAAIVRGGAGPPSLVLLHGYGSRAEDWLQFEDEVAPPGQHATALPAGAAARPLTGQRGWWWLNLEGHVPEGERLRRLSRRRAPAGSRSHRASFAIYLEDVNEPIILGGFSQGAMTSAEIAFQSDQALAGLILLGGTTVE